MNLIGIHEQMQRELAEAIVLDRGPAAAIGLFIGRALSLSYSPQRSPRSAFVNAETSAPSFVTPYFRTESAVALLRARLKLHDLALQLHEGFAPGGMGFRCRLAQQLRQLGDIGGNRP
jgi:hypothetical protein